LIDLATIGNREGDMAAMALSDGSIYLKRIGKSLAGGLSHLRQFESIGGLGASIVASVGRDEAGLGRVISARLIVGVLYKS
jgi:hypothetical protein